MIIHPLSFLLAAMPLLVSAVPEDNSTVANATLEKREHTLIPYSCLDSTASLTKYFEYNYPWGDTHNGAAIMRKSKSVISTPGTLTLSATYTGASKYTYDSGTVFSKQKFTVKPHGGLDFIVDVVAPVQKGTWPAFWLNGANTWPPEVDIGEWKGTGLISFNTFNSSSKVMAHDIHYANPNNYHTIFAQLRDENGKDVSVKFYLDGVLITTQYASNLVDQPMNLIIDLQMEGSSGSPGPRGTTHFQIKNLKVIGVNQ